MCSSQTYVSFSFLKSSFYSKKGKNIKPGTYRMSSNKNNKTLSREKRGCFLAVSAISCLKGLDLELLRDKVIAQMLNYKCKKVNLRKIIHWIKDLFSFLEMSFEYIRFCCH